MKRTAQRLVPDRGWDSEESIVDPIFEEDEEQQAAATETESAFRPGYINRKAMGITARIILPRKDLTKAAKLVAIALATRAGAQTNRCWPSINRIAVDTGLSRVSVISALKELEAGEWLTKTPGSTGRRSNRYDLEWLS